MDQSHRFGIDRKPRALQIALRPSCIEIAIKDGEFRRGRGLLSHDFKDG
jgi:hypothetical protein